MYRCQRQQRWWIPRILEQGSWLIPELLADPSVTPQPVQFGLPIYPLAWHGGQASLQFALGELFSNFGKIKEIKVYIEKDANDIGGLGCQKSVADTAFEEGNLTGNALVVYHKTKHTGSHDKGDPVYDACTELDGKVRVLGKRHWRIRL